MTARSNPLAALTALGARLRASGAVAAPCPAERPNAHALSCSEGLTRLRAVLAGEAPTDDLTVEQLARYAARYKPETARRSLGRTGGYERPRCGGCCAYLKHVGAQCSACGFFGDGGYLGVPAKTSHLERWR